MSEGKPKDVNPYESPKASDEPMEAEIVKREPLRFTYYVSQDEFNNLMSKPEAQIPVEKLLLFPPDATGGRVIPAVGDTVIVGTTKGHYQGTIQVISGNEVTVARD